MNENVSLVFSGVVTVSTVIYALLTWRLMNETLRMRKAQTDPKIVIYLRSVQYHLHFLELAIKNIGLGLAYDVKFKILEEFEVPGDRKLSDIDFIKEGIDYMPPSHEITTYFLNLLENYKNVIDKKIGIEIVYKNQERNLLREVIKFNMSSFKGVQKLGEDPVYSISKAIENIKDNIDLVSRGSRHIAVDVYTKDDQGKKS